MRTDLAIREVAHDAPLTAIELRQQVNLVQEVMKAVMRDGEHFGKIPGCGEKPTLLQPGAQKLIMTFRLVPDAEVDVVSLPREHREYRVKVKMYSQGGTLLGSGIGSCSTMEGKYRYRTGPVEFTERPVPKSYWDLRQSDPAKAKALLGEGMVAKKNEAGTWVCARQGEKVEHDNPADYYNTCEKMAFKRALVSATLTVTAASDIFTQDIEDMPDGLPALAAQPAPTPAAPPSPSKGEAVLSKIKREGASPSAELNQQWLSAVADCEDYLRSTTPGKNTLRSIRDGFHLPNGQYPKPPEQQSEYLSMLQSAVQRMQQR